MSDIKREALVRKLSESIFKQLRDSPYFPCLALNYFDHDVSDNLIRKAWEKLEPRWGKRSDEDIKRLVYIYWRREAMQKWRKFDKGETDVLSKSLYVDPCDYEAIDEIGSYKTISLFELAVFIGKKVLRDSRSLIFDCPDLFAEYILTGQLNPRNPESQIPYDKTPKKSKIASNGIQFSKELPDLSWELANEEAAQFAELVWGCGGIFTVQTIPIEQEHSKQTYESSTQKDDDVIIPKTKFYSAELEAANAVYIALYTNGEISANQGHVNQIKKWLKNHYGNLTKTQIDRIATVVNPNKNGGAPKTS